MDVQERTGGLLGGYRRALGGGDFRRLWLGSSISLVGDGMTFVALAWLVLSRPGGVRQLGLLTICYTLPVFAGGLLVGPVLDRFDKRYVLAADSVVRGAVVASIPLMAAVGRIPAALPFVVAAVYALLKMVPLAGFPAAIPDLVPAGHRDAANALESLSFGVAGMVGPALGGLLIAAVGSGNVLAFDAVSYAAFAVAALTVRRPLSPDGHGEPDHSAEPDRSLAARPGMSALLRDRVLVTTTLAFMAFNIAEGMLLVVGPWLAKTHLPGGAKSLGLLLATLYGIRPRKPRGPPPPQSVGEFAGAIAAGARSPRGNPVRAIALVEVIAATGFLAVLATPHTLGVAAGFGVIGLFSAPMTIWAQSLRMERIPPSLRGRGFATLRTLMQSTPPIGALLVTPMLQSGHLGMAAITMTILAAAPALLLLNRGG